jgi:hypothetical protein
LGVVLTIIVAIAEDKSKRKYLHMFLVNRLFSIGSVISILILIGGATTGIFTHYTIILVTSGVICVILSLFSWRKAKSNPPLRLPYFWVGMAFILGVFCIFAAYALLPAITAANGWATFIILILLAFTFVIRVVVVAKPQLFVGVGGALFIASQTANWLTPKTYFGASITFSPELIWTVSIVAFIVALIVIYVLVHVVTDAASHVNRALNSFPVLFVLGLLSAVWGLGLGVFGWQL